ncbi:MAG: hypothetical protein V4662_25430 [Verrucomicrobiota bacterium]
MTLTLPTILLTSCYGPVPFNIRTSNGMHFSNHGYRAQRMPRYAGGYPSAYPNTRAPAYPASGSNPVAQRAPSAKPAASTVPKRKAKPMTDQERRMMDLLFNSGPGLDPNTGSIILGR